MRNLLIIILFTISVGCSKFAFAQVDSARLAKTEKQIERDRKAVQKADRRIAKAEKKASRKERKLKKRENAIARREKSREKKMKKIRKQEEQLENIKKDTLN